MLILDGYKVLGSKYWVGDDGILGDFVYMVKEFMGSKGIGALWWQWGVRYLRCLRRSLGFRLWDEQQEKLGICINCCLQASSQYKEGSIANHQQPRRLYIEQRGDIYF